MISDKKLQTAIGFVPHKGQVDILKSKSRDITICAGRRFGKSAVCAYVALKTFLNGIDDIKSQQFVPMWH